MKQIFRIPATWTVRGEFIIEADSIEEAKELVFDTDTSDAKGVQYVDDTFELDQNGICTVVG